MEQSSAREFSCKHCATTVNRCVLWAVCGGGGGGRGESYRTLGVCPSLRINRLFTLLSSLLLLYHAPGSDLNGGLNMLCIFERHVLNGERPEYLRRPGKGSSTKSSVTTAPATTVAAAGWWQLGAVLL